jgi:hypothetical protein
LLPWLGPSWAGVDWFVMKLLKEKYEPALLRNAYVCAREEHFENSPEVSVL